MSFLSPTPPVSAAYVPSDSKEDPTSLVGNEDSASESANGDGSSVGSDVRKLMKMMDDNASGSTNGDGIRSSVDSELSKLMKGVIAQGKADQEKERAENSCKILRIIGYI